MTHDNAMRPPPALRSTSRSPTREGGSLRSSAPATSLIGSPPATAPTRAISPAASSPVTVRFTRGGAIDVLGWSDGARRTVVHVPPLGRSTTTVAPAAPDERAELRAMLGIPRPKTRGECLEEARPCPWVACRHHLLLEQSNAQRTRSHAGPGLVLQAPSATAARRKQLAPTAPELVVRAWIDDAVERLAGMLVSCSLDRADQGAAPEREAAELAGLHYTTLRRRRRRAIQALAERSNGGAQ